MTEQRRLAAIMFSDVCGFSRIMGEDEKRALAIVEMASSAMEDAASKYEGRVIKKMGKHFQGTICYSLTERRMGGPVYNLDYFLNKARIIEDMGADSLCIKDMAGLLAPLDAFGRCLPGRRPAEVQQHRLGGHHATLPSRGDGPSRR